MGCPPDPVEVTIWRSSDRIGALQEKYDLLRMEYSETVKIARRLKIPVMVECSEFPERRFSRRATVSPTESEPYADANHQWLLESECSKTVKALETALCTLRTQLMVSDTFAKTGGEEFLRQRTLHRAHREEDRAQWLQWLWDRQRLLQSLIRDNAHASLDLLAAGELVAALQKEIRRIEDISENTLLTDRKCLHADEKLWEVPYRA